jgi:signal peptidase I
VLAILVVLGALWLLFLRPPFLGGTTSYVIVSGSSMEPTLGDDDLVLVRERGSYAVGDVVAFELDDVGPEGAVIHRIVGGNETDGFVTRGDNRDADDEWVVPAEDILGRRIARVPKIGAVLHWLAQPLVIGLMVGAALATLYWTLRIHGARGRRTPAPAPARPARPDPGMPARTPAYRPPPPAPRPEPEPVAVGAPNAEPGGHEDVATRNREKFERADPETKRKMRQLVFEQAMAYKAEDPDFDTTAFLRMCGAHAYDGH